MREMIGFTILVVMNLMKQIKMTHRPDVNLIEKFLCSVYHNLKPRLLDISPPV